MGQGHMTAAAVLYIPSSGSSILLSNSVRRSRRSGMATVVVNGVFVFGGQ